MNRGTDNLNTSLPLMNADVDRLITVCRSLITKDGGEDLNANIRKWTANVRNRSVAEIDAEGIKS